MKILWIYCIWWKIVINIIIVNYLIPSLMWLLIPIEVTLKHDFNSLTKEEKSVLLFEEKGYILSDKEHKRSEKNESHRVPCFLKAQIFFVSNLYWPIFRQLFFLSKLFPSYFYTKSLGFIWIGSSSSHENYRSII